MRNLILITLALAQLHAMPAAAQDALYPDQSGISRRIRVAEAPPPDDGCYPPFCFHLPSLYPAGKGPADYAPRSRR